MHFQYGIYTKLLPLNVCFMTINVTLYELLSIIIYTSTLYAIINVNELPAPDVTFFKESKLKTKLSWVSVIRASESLFH